jgi:hypothetical protein
VWDNDIAVYTDGPATDLEGHRLLQRVLATEALLAAELGRMTDVSDALTAMWRINQPLLAGPQPPSQAAGRGNLELQLAVLSRLDQPPEGWRERLSSQNPMASALAGYLCETWQIRQRAETLLDSRHSILGFIIQPFARALAVHHEQTMLFAVTELPDRDVTTFDPDEFGAELFARVPRWNTASRAALPADWSTWPHSVRTALRTELTERVLELRSRPDAVDRIQPRQPAGISGLSWSYEVRGSAVTISIEPEPFAGAGGRPLRATVDLSSRPRRVPAAAGGQAG